MQRPDGSVRPLLFDGSPLLSSAVFAEPDGRLLVGRDAERGAGVDPARFEPNPKRRINDLDVLLGGRQFTMVELVAAALQRVAVEAVRIAGGPVSDVTMTCPAAWGQARRRVLTDAAAVAGLGPVTMVPEPVAAASYFAGVLGRWIPAGHCVVVYDLGAGTFDASVVRHAPEGLDTLACRGVDDFGGLDLDAMIVERIGAVLSVRTPEVWRRLSAAGDTGDTGDLRHRRMLWDDARQAREALSREPSVGVHCVLAEQDVYVTREEFEAVAAPALTRTVEVTVATLREARVPADQVAGWFLVGGASRTPLVATLLHRGTGQPPVVLEDPQVVVAEGALHATANTDWGGPAASLPSMRTEAGTSFATTDPPFVAVGSGPPFPGTASEPLFGPPYPGVPSGPPYPGVVSGPPDQVVVAGPPSPPYPGMAPDLPYSGVPSGPSGQVVVVGPPSPPAPPYPGVAPGQPYPGVAPGQPYPGVAPGQPYPGVASAPPFPAAATQWPGPPGNAVLPVGFSSPPPQAEDAGTDLAPVVSLAQLAAAPVAEAAGLLAGASTSVSADLLGELTPRHAADVLATMPVAVSADLLAAMAADRAAVRLATMPPPLAVALLVAMPVRAAAERLAIIPVRVSNALLLQTPPPVAAAMLAAMPPNAAALRLAGIHPAATAYLLATMPRPAAANRLTMMLPVTAATALRMLPWPVTQQLLVLMPPDAGADVYQAIRQA